MLNFPLRHAKLNVGRSPFVLLKHGERFKSTTAASLLKPKSAINILPRQLNDIFKTEKPIFNYLSLLKPELKLFIAGSVLMLGSVSVSMYVPTGIGQVLDIIAKGHGNLVFTLSIMSAVLLVGCGINFARISIFKWTNEKIINDTRKTLFRSLVFKNMSVFDQYSTGDLISRLASDTNIAGKSLTLNLSEGIKYLGQGVMGLFLMHGISPKLCAYLFGILPPIAILATIYGKMVKKISINSQESLALSLSFADERLQNIRTVKIFGRENLEAFLFNQKINRLLSFSWKDSIAAGSLYALTGLLANIALIALLYLSSTMVISGDVTIGSLSAFLMYTVYAGTSVSGLTSTYAEFTKGLGAYERISPFLPPLKDVPVTNQVNHAVLNPITFTGSIKFVSASFSYPKQKDKLLLDGCSFELAIPGSITVLMGDNGTGKSTIINLLMKLYPLSSGAIIIDDKYDLKDLDLQSLIDNISILPQEPVLFQDTILNNISYARPNASFAEIEKAAQLAFADAFIQNLPEKYETQITNKGNSLSGGQKQRIAIARAILKGCNILIFDEPTSALDIDSENFIHQTLKHLSKTGKAIILITHKKSTARIADRQLILDNGTIKINK